MRVFKNNIVTPFQTETYWIYNLFLSHMPCLLLIINTIYEVRADLYLHLRGRLCKRWGRMLGGGGGEKLNTYCCNASNMEAFSWIQAAGNKPVTKWLWFTYLQPAMFQVLLSSSLLRTRWLAVRSLLAANIKDAHTELISRGHLYNNTFAQSQRCRFDLEQWPVLPLVFSDFYEMAFGCYAFQKDAPMTTVKDLIISHLTAC